MMLIKNNLKTLLVTFLACYSLNLNAQVNESENFVYLYSDSVIYAKNIRLRTTLFNSLQLRADSKPIELKQTKFFKNDEGFFANTSRMNVMGNEAFSVRVIRGKINLFEERTAKNNPQLFDEQPHVYHTRNTVDVRMFYNKGYEHLKKVNYKNLKRDMADDPQSLDILEGYRKNMKTSMSLYVAAGASVAAAILALVTDTKDKQEPFQHFPMNGQFPNIQDKPRRNFTPSIVLFGLGGGFALGGYAVNQAGLRKLESAVDSYNR